MSQKKRCKQIALIIFAFFTLLFSQFLLYFVYSYFNKIIAGEVEFELESITVLVNLALSYLISLLLSCDAFYTLGKK